MNWQEAGFQKGQARKCELSSMIIIGKIQYVIVPVTSIISTLEGPGEWQNIFTITRFCCIKVLFHIFYYYWGQENCL